MSHLNLGILHTSLFKCTFHLNVLIYRSGIKESNKMEWTTKGCDDKTRTSTFLSADQGYLSSDKNDSGLPSNSLESVTQCLESVNIITPASETRTVHNKAGCLDSKDFDDEDYFSLEEQEQKMQLKRDYLLNKALKQDDDGDS